MAIKKDKKVDIMSRVRDIFDKNVSTVFVNFHGLSVGETTTLRSNLRGQSVGFTVAKKTLIKRALDELTVEGNIPELLGEVAIAYGEDSIAPAREVYEFQKTHKNNVAILGGIFEGKYKDKEEMTEIASIPSMQVLRGMFVNVINSPIQGLAVALNEIAKSKEA
jgi:large subunit ribosomal protein L10